MGLFQSLSGSLCVQIVSADISELLTQISKRNITLQAVKSIDALTVEVTVCRKDYRNLNNILERNGAKGRIVDRHGVYWKLRTLKSRPVLMVGVILFLLLALYLPGRIMFVQVEGNSFISDKRIVDEARNCGIVFGASCRAVRSEKVKNALLQAIPELQWVGVNTAGCVATIQVTEKENTEKKDDELTSVGNVIAARDGVIWDCTVTRGNALCQVGQAVRAGQILISGYADCGLAIKATRAEGEIFAQTWRNVDMVSPTVFAKKQHMWDEETNYSLILGKKLINLCKDSGISDASCVKIYSESYLTLPGGYQLPFGILKETVLYYEYVDENLTQEASFDWMRASADRYTHSCMIGGQILDQNVSLQIENEVCRLQGEYACLEMIGQFKEEEFLQR